MFFENMMGMHVLWWGFWVAVVIALVFWGLAGSGAARERARETPHQVLRRRLANGELSTQEYEQRKAVLDRDA